MQMMKARGEKLKGTAPAEMKKANQDVETVSIFILWKYSEHSARCR